MKNKSNPIHKDKLPNSDDYFFCLDIGAFDCGLKTWGVFFQNVHPNPKLAFVGIKHLSPDYKSMMGELLGRHTNLPISSAEDDVDILLGCK